MNKTLKVGNRVSCVAPSIFVGRTGEITHCLGGGNCTVLLDAPFNGVSHVVCREEVLNALPLEFKDLKEGAVARIIDGSRDFLYCLGIVVGKDFVLFPNTTTGYGDRFSDVNNLGSGLRFEEVKVGIVS